VRFRGAFLLRFTFQSNLARSEKYRADIDGLRALAVVPVILFHARVPGFSGGFVGVDIFYVVSGYLITALIEKEIEQGRFSFVMFYERRIRRIFPALFGTVSFCILAAAVILAPRDFRNFGKSLVAMTCFASNILFNRDSKVGYFGGTSESEVLLHTWSLAVEEQFYVFFPMTLLLLTRWAKKRRIEGLAFICVLSFAASIWMTIGRPIGAFYFLWPRAWELLVGSLLAMGAVPALESKVLRELLGLLGLGLIGWAVFSYSDETTFPGLGAVPPCLGACLIVYAGEHGPSRLKSALSFGPLVFVGITSYSLYLWHWPLFVFSRRFAAGELTAAQTALVIAAAFFLAFFSFEFIERPFRGRNSPITRRQVFALGFAVSAACALLGLGIYLDQGCAWRFGRATRELLRANTERRQDFEQNCGNWKTEVHSVNDIRFCDLGPASAKEIMFWGDSHVQQLYPVMKDLIDNGDLKGRGATFAVADGCPPTEHMNAVRKGYHCDSFAHFALVRARDPDIESVFIAFSTWWQTYDFLCPSVDGRCTSRISPEAARQMVLQEISEEIRALRTAGKRVILSLPFPVYNKTIPDLEIRNAIFGGLGLAGVARDRDLASYTDQMALVATHAGAEIFDPRKSLCGAAGCLTEVDGVSIYTDNNHIAASQIGIFRDALKQLFP
jgi:peptidoglycan/LPS O-acetylase OafA/YrhL